MGRDKEADNDDSDFNDEIVDSVDHRGMKIFVAIIITVMIQVMMMLIMMTADENDNGDGRQECRWENNLITTKNLYAEKYT